MTTIWQRLENDFTADEKWVVTQVDNFGAGVSSLMKAIDPAAAEDASTLIQGVITMAVNAGVALITGLPVGKLLTSVISLAEVLGKDFVAKIEPTALTAIANIHLAGAIATQTAANTNAAPGEIGAAA